MNNDFNDRSKDLNTETKFITAGYSHKKNSWRFVNPPVYRGSTVLFDSFESLMNDTIEYVYGRWGTPTSEAFCQAMTELELGEGAIVACSGLSAITTLLLSLAKPASHILISDTSYLGALRFCDQFLLGRGVEIEKFSSNDANTLHQKIRSNTALIYLDIPGSYGGDVLNLTDLKKELKNLPVIVDNTWATPYYFNPIQFGADVVVHSTSKYIAGHSDSIMGCLVFKNKDMYLKIREITRVLGQYAGADDLNLALRGLRTLSVRMKQHYDSAIKVAIWLETQKEVKKVLYAPLLSHEDHANWAQQFRGAGGVLSFILQDKFEQHHAQFLNNLKLINLGWGWGGYESLASASTISSGKYAGRLAIKLSIGLEAPQDLILDLESAFLKSFP